MITIPPNPTSTQLHRASIETRAEARSLELLLLDGFDDAFMGLATRFGFPDPVAVYDRAHCIRILIERGMTEDEAEEYFEFNIISAWIGRKTPLFFEAL